MPIPSTWLVKSLMPSLSIALLFSACGDSESESKDGGHVIKPDEIKEILNTSEHDKALVMMAVDAIQLQENYTPENFEQKQREGIALMTPDYQKAAEDYLPTRVQQVKDGQFTSRFEPDLESAKLKKMKFGDSIRATVEISGIRHFTSEGKEHPPKTGNFTVNFLVHSLDDYEIHTIGVN